jgi:hypothetical protein
MTIEEREEGIVKSFVGETMSFWWCLRFGCFGQSSLKVTHSGNCCPAVTVMFAICVGYDHWPRVL